VSADVLTVCGAVTSSVKLNHDNEGTTMLQNVGTTSPATKRQATEDLLLQFFTCLAIIRDTVQVADGYARNLVQRPKQNLVKLRTM
jgi:hypothetical protein